ncbi:MAG: hypothetical protein KAR20_09235, partial [Candidatus Heimdallarchaeota archaeon]|nr:hypothetical protein [Candidatus Heimdallarchaeota archaeon]
ENVLFASCRAAYLYKEICGGNTDEPFLDINYIRSGIRIIQLNSVNVERLIGIKITTARIQTILQSLGFTVNPGKGKDSLSVTVPSFREDVSLEADLIEEVARIEGFDNIKEAMPPITAHIDSAYTDSYIAKTKVRQLLLAKGLNEIVTFTLMSGRSLDDAKIDVSDRAFLVNPLSIEQEVLRTSLLPSTLKVINTNLNRRVKQVKVFEIGSVYKRTKNKFSQTECAAVALTGTSYQNWMDHSRKVTFYDLKGIIESLIEGAGINEYILQGKKIDCFASEESAVITVKDKVIAELGKVSKMVSKNFDISDEVFFAQIDLSALFQKQKIDYFFTPVPRYPSVVRD